MAEIHINHSPVIPLNWSTAGDSKLHRCGSVQKLKHPIISTKKNKIEHQFLHKRR